MGSSINEGISFLLYFDQRIGSAWSVDTTRHLTPKYYVENITINNPVKKTHLTDIWKKVSQKSAKVKKVLRWRIDHFCNFFVNLQSVYWWSTGKLLVLDITRKYKHARCTILYDGKKYGTSFKTPLAEMVSWQQLE